MTHGPGSTADEFQSDAEIIQEMTRFQHVDEVGREVDNGIKHQGNNGQYNHSQ